MALDGLPDLWASRTKGWSANALASLNTALAATMWRRYRGYLRRFHDFCWMCDIAFPPPASLAVAVTANFIEQVTRTSKRPASTIGGISAAIAALYEPLDLHPMHDPLIARLQKGIVHTCTHFPIEKSTTFNPTALHDLFHKWGAHPSKTQLRAKLLALLCLVGAFHMSASALPYFNTINQASSQEKLVVPVVGFKNDRFSEGNTVTIYPSSDPRCCPVAAFSNWKARTSHLHAGVHKCHLLFTLNGLAKGLSTGDCASILHKMAEEASLDVGIFTPKSFQKSGIMASLTTGVHPDTILKLGRWASTETFWHHYIAHAIPQSYTNIIFNMSTLSP